MDRLQRRQRTSSTVGGEGGFDDRGEEAELFDIVILVEPALLSLRPVRCLTILCAALVWICRKLETFMAVFEDYKSVVFER